MGDAAYRGISVDHGDSRFSRRQEKDLAALASQGKFPPSFATKVDMKKVNLDVIRPWIADKTKELLGFEDDVVTEYAVGMLEGDDNRNPDPKKMQLGLTGFLESQTPEFMSSLWTLLLDAQSSPGGIPRELVEKKKQELARARAADAEALRGAGVRGAPSSRGLEADYRRDDGRQGGGGGSRWGPPHGAGRGGGGGEKGPPGGFKDKSGNVTERVQDVGWGARGGDNRNRDDDDGRGGGRGGGGGGRWKRRSEDTIFDRDRSSPGRGSKHDRHIEVAPSHREHRNQPRVDYTDRGPRQDTYQSATYDQVPQYDDRRRYSSRSPPPQTRRQRDASYDSRGRSPTPPPRRRDDRHNSRSRSRSRSRTRSRSPVPRYRDSYRSRRGRSRSRSVTPPAKRGGGAGRRDYTPTPSPPRGSSRGKERDRNRERRSPSPQPLKKKSRWD